MRDDFPANVIQTLGKRTGMRCSNPACRQLTSGPTAQPESAINVGVAAHITAASLGGPRYDGTLTPEKRSSIENGVWLCQTCAKLIDSDTTRYSVAHLCEWKKGAEAVALAELESGRSPNVPSVNAAVLIQGEGAIRISGTNAVNIAPGGITIIGPVVRK